MDVATAHAALQDEGDPTNWYLVGIDSSRKLEVQASGSGGLDELRRQFQNDQVQFGCCTIFALDIRNGVISRREKFIRVKFIGEDVAAMKRGRAMMVRLCIGATLWIRFCYSVILQTGGTHATQTSTTPTPNAT